MTNAVSSTKRIIHFAGISLSLLMTISAFAVVAVSVSGVVRDFAGAAVKAAEVSLLTEQRVIITTARTDDEGRFNLSDVPTGNYFLLINAAGFPEYRESVMVRESPVQVRITLGQSSVNEEVTVTASPGLLESIESIPQQVSVMGEREIQERAKTVVAQVAAEEAGVSLQRTSPTIAGIFVRGLTGNKVNVFVDGVRYSTSAARGGINTFLDLIDPSSLQGVEILRGPNSAQYGSDAIGGSVQFLSRIPAFSSQGSEWQSNFGAFVNSVDAGFGSSLATAYASPNFGLLASITGRRTNPLRPGEGVDSHNAVTRFFGLSSDLVIDDRLPDTGFTQYGGMFKINWSPAPGSQIIAGYVRGQQDGGKRYDQLLGGDGNLIADLRNLMLDLFYLRYEKTKLGWFDHFTSTYSFNTQREERVNQGGNGNPRASINHEPERTNVNGFQVQASKLLGVRQTLLFGGEYYNERIDSPSFKEDPVTGLHSVRRGRIPDNAHYQSGGVYVEHVFDAVPDKVRLFTNIRTSAAYYEARAEDSPLVNGEPLWPDDSLSVDSVTYRAGVVFTPREHLNLLANVSRGFRAPHMTDLGTLGLTGSGFEVAAPDVAGLGATVGSTADRNAVSTGEAVQQLKPESSQTYEFGFRYHKENIDTDFSFFINDINDNITKQALILPPGAVGTILGDQVITAQNENGVVFVSASPNPVLVQANFDDARLYGIEHTFNVKLHPDWSLGAIFTYIHAEDKRTGLPPNLEGGTPAPDLYLKIRYAPNHRSLWAEPYLHGALRQDRLSSLDLEDRRTGATRSRSSITSFFYNGATVRGLVGPGADGLFGTADDVLLATGETLDRILERVLGPGLTSNPLFPEIPGYATFNVRFGFRIGEQHGFLLEFENITNKNYRGISWGVDGPGRGVYLRYNTRF